MTITDIANADLLAEDEIRIERQLRALTLRNAGATYRQIAEKTGVSTATARKDVSSALRDVVSETAEDLIARQRAILLDLTRANYAAAASGDIDAARLLIAVMEREARLFGLDAPTRVNVGVSDVEFAERTASLIQSLGLQPPKELAAMSSALRESFIDAEVDEDQLAFDLADGDGTDGDAPGVRGVPSESDGWSNI